MAIAHATGRAAAVAMCAQQIVVVIDSEPGQSAVQL
jgi:hypothetical protein